MTTYSAEPSEYIPGTPGAGWNDDEVKAGTTFWQMDDTCVFLYLPLIQVATVRQKLFVIMEVKAAEKKNIYIFELNY